MNYVVFHRCWSGKRKELLSEVKVAKCEVDQQKGLMDGFRSIMKSNITSNISKKREVVKKPNSHL
jgi:hypothetical protein